eukprot:208439-Alexandrium_andersonii.AAC.1
MPLQTCATAVAGLPATWLACSGACGPCYLDGLGGHGATANHHSKCASLHSCVGGARACLGRNVRQCSLPLFA